MALPARAAWAQSPVPAIDAPTTPALGSTGPAPATESGAMTERQRGKHGGRNHARRKHFATTRSKFARKMEQRNENAAVDNVGLKTEAQINRKLAELQKKDLISVTRLASKLRTDFDRLRVQATSKSEQLRAIQDQLGRLERLASKQNSTSVVGQSIRRADKRLKRVYDRYDEALRNREMYTFMATRLKQQTMLLDKEAKDMQEELAVSRQDQEQATLNVHAVKQERAAAEALVAQLQKKLASGRIQREEKLARFDSTIQDQEEKRRQMEERERRRIEIARLAQGDLNLEGEDRLKQLFLVRKIYSNMLLSKLQDQRRRTDKLADAFQRIRSATGLSEVSEIVAKFMSRDKTNKHLLVQMSAARQRIDDLRATNVRLQHLIDAQMLVRTTQHENRQLYQRVDDFDRRLSEARRLSEEAKHRSFRVMITLEESRACIARLLNKLEVDMLAQSSRRRGTSRSSSGRHKDAVNEGFTVNNGTIVVEVDKLPDAIDLLDQRLTKYLEVVAAIFDKEEQLGTVTKDEGPGTVRRMSLTTAKEVLATVAANGPSLLNNLSARQQPGLGASDTDAARSSTLSMLAGKASDRVYRSMMEIVPDTSSANLRVQATSRYKSQPSEDASDAESYESEEELDYLAQQADPSVPRRNRGFVVQRDSLKRLSAMLSEKKVRKRGAVKVKGRKPPRINAAAIAERAPPSP